MTQDRERPDLRAVSTSDEHEPEKLTLDQRTALANLLARVFVMLRSPGYQYFWDKREDWNDVEKLKAAVDRSVAFGEVFHNVPHFLHHDGFDFDLQERLMSAYLKRCPDLKLLIEDFREIREMGKNR